MITSLTQSIYPRLRHSIDILLFNPPYVPTDTSEADAAQLGADIAGAWAGGIDGMKVTDVLLEQVAVSSHLCFCSYFLTLCRN